MSIDKRPLGAQMNASAMAAFVGPVVSSREIPMHPAGVRKANVSASGIVWYVDHPEDRISHLHFALSPSDTPEHPPSFFGGSIRLNTVELTTEVSEAEFPRDGEVLVRGRHHNWFYETAGHHVSFVFKRRRNRMGKRSGTYRLASPAELHAWAMNVLAAFQTNMDPADAVAVTNLHAAFHELDKWPPHAYVYADSQPRFDMAEAVPYIKVTYGSAAGHFGLLIGPTNIPTPASRAHEIRYTTWAPGVWFFDGQ